MQEGAAEYTEGDSGQKWITSGETGADEGQGVEDRGIPRKNRRLAEEKTDIKLSDLGNETRSWAQRRWNWFSQRVDIFTGNSVLGSAKKWKEPEINWRLDHEG